VCQSTGQPGFPDPGGTGDEHVQVFLQPLAAGQALDKPFIQAPSVTVINIFEGGGVSQLGPAQAAARAQVVSFGHFLVDQQSKALREA